MTVKEAVTMAAKELGIYEDVQGVLDGTGTDGEEKVRLLVDCFNIVENELALDYLPLQAEDEMYSTTGTIEFAALRYQATRILHVTDEWGNRTKFSLFPAYLKTQPGKVKIGYTYTPEPKTLEGESDYRLYVSTRLLAYGIAAEYAYAVGLFEEASVWDKKYKDAITAAYRVRPCARLRSRRWA